MDTLARLRGQDACIAPCSWVGSYHCEVERRGEAVDQQGLHSRSSTSMESGHGPQRVNQRGNVVAPLLIVEPRVTGEDDDMVRRQSPGRAAGPGRDVTPGCSPE